MTVTEASPPVAPRLPVTIRLSVEVRMRGGRSETVVLLNTIDKAADCTEADFRPFGIVRESETPFVGGGVQTSVNRLQLRVDGYDPEARIVSASCSLARTDPWYDRGAGWLFWGCGFNKEEAAT